MGNGKHGDTDMDTNTHTGRQRSGPEEGKHARQPEGPTGKTRGAGRKERSEPEEYDG